MNKRSKNICLSVISVLVIAFLAVILCNVVLAMPDYENGMLNALGFVKGGERDLAEFAAARRDSFLGFTGNTITGRTFEAQVQNSPIHDFATATCFGHITNVGDSGAHYRVDYVLDINESSQLTVYQNGAKLLTTGSKDDVAKLAYYTYKAATKTGNITDNLMANPTKSVLKVQLNNVVNNNIPNSIYTGHINYDGQLNFIDNSTMAAVVQERNEGIAYANGSISTYTLKDTTTGAAKIERKDSKTYIGPYSIEASNAISISVNGIAAQWATKSQDGTYTIQTGIPSNQFYIVVEGNLYVKNIQSINISSTGNGDRISARLVLVSQPQNNGVNNQYLAIYNAKINPNNSNINLKVPTMEEGQYTIALTKKDADDSNVKLGNVSFTIFQQEKEIGTYTTDANGNLTFPVLKINNTGVESVKIVEKSVDNKYKLLSQPIVIYVTKSEDQELGKYVASSFELKNDSNGNVVDMKFDKATQKITFTAKNNPDYISPTYKIKLNKQDSKDSSIKLKDVEFEATLNGKKLEGIFKTDSNGMIMIPVGEISEKGIDKIVIKEIATNKFYNLLSNPITVNVTKGVNREEWKYEITKVELDKTTEANVSFDEKTMTVLLNIDNPRKTMNLSGYVFEDVKDNKESKIDGKIDTNSMNKDTFIEGMTVTLHTEDGSSIIYSKSATKVTTTDNKGYYEFKDLPVYEKGYYIEFTYNGQVYQHTKYTTWATDSSTDTVKTSNATETESARDNLNKQLEEITPTTTVNSSINSKGPTYIDDEKTTISAYTGAFGNAKDIKNYYETSTNINLGITKRELVDIAIQKDVYKATLSIRGVTQEYEYDEFKGLTTGENGEKYWQVDARRSDVYYGKTYTRNIKQADYNYGAKDSTDKLTATVTYKITLKNLSEDIKTTVTELVDFYDTDYTYKEAHMLTENGTTVIANTTSKYTHNVTINNYDKTYLTINAELAPQEYKELYVTFYVNTDDDGRIKLDSDNGKENIIEITGYKTYYNANTAPNEGNKDTYTEFKAGDIAGRIDSNSNPGNTTSTDINNFENDTDKAPSIKFQLVADRTIDGTVWKDSRNQTVDNAITGNGIMEKGEEKVAGIQVELWDADTKAIAQVWNGTGFVTAVTKTANDGTYNISGYVPGNYYLKFLYPDGQTYKSTTYKSEVNNGFDYNNPDALGTYVETEENYSDARDVWGDNDTQGTRKYVNNLLATETNKKITEYNGFSTESLDSKIAMQAITGKIIVNIEKDANSHVSSERVFSYSKVDFGIVERAKAQLTLEKEVKNVQVKLANGNVLFDASDKGTSNVFWTTKLNHTTGYDKNKTFMNVPVVRKSAQTIQLTMDEELMHGATIKITYAIKVRNVGEVDYTSTQYYYRAEKANNDKIATTTVNEIIDYVGATGSDDSTIKGNNLQFSSEGNTGWKTVTAEELINDGLISSSIESNVKAINTIVKYSFDKALQPENAGGETSVETQIVLSKVMTSSEETGYNNMAEIIKVSNELGRKMNYSTVGNQDPTSDIAEVDSDNATVTVLPPFGQTYIYYVLGISIGAIAIAGIIFIKKKILKK